MVLNVEAVEEILMEVDKHMFILHLQNLHLKIVGQGKIKLWHLN